MFKIFISSRNKFNGNTNSDFQCAFTDAGQRYQRATMYSISLESAILPNLETNINLYNNRLYVRENGITNYTITIPERNYSASELAVQLETSLNDASGLSYDVIFNEQTKKFTITVALPNTFQILDGDASVNRLLGFVGATNIAATHTSAYIIDLSGISYMDIELLGVPNGNLHSNKLRNIFARVPMAEPFGYYVSYINPDAEPSLRFTEDILYSLRIRLRRPDGQLVILPENSEVSIVLKAYPILS